MSATPRPAAHGEAGFTLIEMLVATMVMGFILAALATITAQWMPNWNRGMLAMQQTEGLAFGLKRVAEDLSVMEFVTANADVKGPVFDGTELSVTFVRSAIGPNARPGLEVVRLHEVADANGPTLVRDHTPFTPMPPGTVLQYTDPAVLIRPPYRVTFAYAGADGTWQPSWRDQPELPRSIRIALRDGVTQQTLALSTATLVHADLPADCVRSKTIAECLKPSGPGAANTGTQANAAPPQAASPQ